MAEVAGEILFEAGRVRLLLCIQFSLVQVHASLCMPYLEQGTKQEIWITRNARSESDTESGILKRITGI